MPAYQVIEVMNEATLAAVSTVPATVAGTECEVIDLTDVDDFALTVECTFDELATGSAVVCVRTSPTGGSTVATEWDTEIFETATLSCVAGERVQKTIEVNAVPKYAKVSVENKDATKPITDLVVTKVTT